MKNDKKTLSLTIIAVVTLFVVVIGATYAYFTAQTDSGAGVDIRATTDTTDSLKFEKVSEITFTADMENFTEGKENLMGSSEVKATLLPNSTTNEAIENYNVFFIIDDNDFIYTGTEAELLLKVFDNEGNEITEIDGLKRVENGFDITTRTGSFLVTEGYEIKATNGTEEQTWRAEVTLVNLNSNQNLNKGKYFKGRIYLAKNEVTSMPKINTASTTITNNSVKTTLKIANNTEEIDKYYFAIEELESGLAYTDSSKVKRLANGTLEYQESTTNEYTFTNLDVNTNYKVSSYMIDKKGLVSNIYQTIIRTGEDSIPEIESVDITVTHDKITINVTPKAGQNITKYMYSKDDGVTWEESESPNYIYNEVEGGTTYYLKIKLLDDINKESSEYEDTIRTEKLFLSNYIKNLYTTQGENSLYLHDSTLENGAGDGSYRYAGADPSNYVCFGSDEATCSEDNLYQIIGVFGDQVKLIKSDYATSELLGTDGDYKENINAPYYKGSQTTIARYYWNYKNDTTINNRNGSNNWSISLLNKVNLNTNYLNNIGEIWASKIAMTTWYLGGWDTDVVYVKAMYGYERGITVPSGNPTTYEAKVGLVYPSDYGYATTPSNWTTTMNYYNGTNIKNNNWMYLGGGNECTLSPRSSYSNIVFVLSGGNLGMGYANYGYGIRPVLYLEASTVLTDGDGTKNLPYRIN